MAKKRRKRLLRNLHIDEVSLVDKPANDMPFTFVKMLDPPAPAPGFRLVGVDHAPAGSADDDVGPAELAEMVDGAVQEALAGQGGDEEVGLDEVQRMVGDAVAGALQAGRNDEEIDVGEATGIIEDAVAGALQAKRDAADNEEVSVDEAVAMLTRAVLGNTDDPDDELSPDEISRVIEQAVGDALAAEGC